MAFVATVLVVLVAVTYESGKVEDVEEKESTFFMHVDAPPPRTASSAYDYGVTVALGWGEVMECRIGVVFTVVMLLTRCKCDVGDDYLTTSTVMRIRVPCPSM